MVEGKGTRSNACASEGGRAAGRPQPRGVTGGVSRGTAARRCRPGQGRFSAGMDRRPQTPVDPCDTPESPPPMTAMGWLRNMGAAPSQTAQAEMPLFQKPLSSSDPGKGRRRATAPVATITASATTSFSSAAVTTAGSCAGEGAGRQGGGQDSAAGAVVAGNASLAIAGAPLPLGQGCWPWGSIRVSPAWPGTASKSQYARSLRPTRNPSAHPAAAHR